MRKLRVLDLFSGIGGFSLGLERTGGFETVAFCEIEPFCRRVLKKHWPDVPIYEDVTKLTATEVCKDTEVLPDVICGGFPCQDISNAGHQEGIGGERSGLWKEYARLIREIRPSFVLVENVSALLHRGMGDVLGDLAAIGYDAEWHSIPACAVGAPHIRDRIWILAYPGRELGRLPGYFESGWITRDGCSGSFPKTDSRREAKRGKDWELAEMVPGIYPGVAADWWRHQSSVARAADGLPGQMDRNKGLGNAVVPQIPEMIGHAILQARAG